MPYRARVNERTLLNLPGFHAGAYVYVYVEDTSDRDRGRECFEPRTILEIADCDRRIELQFELCSSEGRENSLHKLDTLVSALRLFREAFVAEFEPYDSREQEREREREREALTV